MSNDTDSAASPLGWMVMTHTKEIGMIDTSRIHPSFKENEFKYSATVMVNEEESKAEGPKHRILTRKKRKSEKWVYLGGSEGALEYPTEEAAQDDVRRLKEWAAS